MSRRKPIPTEAEVAALTERCEDFGLDIHAMCDRLDGAFGDDALRAAITTRMTRQVNAVALAASLLNSKLLAMRAMDEDARDLRVKLEARLQGGEP